MPRIYVLPDTGFVDVIIFDVVTSSITEDGAEVTKYPVELGADLSDHYRRLPIVYSITGIVSNTPIVVPASPGGVNPGPSGKGTYQTLDVELPAWTEPTAATPGYLFRAAGALVEGAVGAIGDAIFGADPKPQMTVFAFPEIFNRPLEVETILQKIKALAIACTVITETRQFANMMLTGNTASKTVAGAKSFDLVFEEVHIATTEITAAPLPAEPRGAPGVDAGSQGKKDLSPSDSAASASIALKLAQGSGLLSL